jgi:putative DNA methylase
MSLGMTTRKKLIEVALPLPEINDASAYDKMPGIGPHPKGIHQWWARLPLPTARAILFASVVDDPGACPDKWPTEADQDAERERLFEIIRQLMGKKIHDRPEVYAVANSEMLKHCDGKLPEVLDPFAGGGSIPLEAHRLGFDAQATDLNPVAVLINKALLEIAPTWADHEPVHPSLRGNAMLDGSWRGTKGLAEDIRKYAANILIKARKQITCLYPTGPNGRTAVAWFWCRTVVSPDPACRGAHVPLIRSFRIAKRKQDSVWLEPVVDRSTNEWRLTISDQKPAVVSTIGRRGGKCLIGGAPISLEYIRDEGKAGRLGTRLVAVIADGREYFAAGDWQEPKSLPDLSPDIVSELMPHNPFAVRPPLYGFLHFRDVFTDRQLCSLGLFSDLVQAEKADIVADAQAVYGVDKGEAYANAVTTFLAFILDRCVDFNNSLCRWSASNQKVMSTFGRQAIPMIWDFAEANIIANSVGSWSACSDYISKCVAIALIGSNAPGTAQQANASEHSARSNPLMVSTDPPYYNNVDYSDLSDFFYVWLRRTIGKLYPDLFNTVLTPKTKELVASPYRFDGDKDAARNHFESGFRGVFGGLRGNLDERFPMTVYYAFKQADESEDPDEEDVDEEKQVDTTTGWETLLEALIGSGFQITATWPVRASQKWRQMSIGMNSLASYIVLACRARHSDAPRTDRRTFIAELKRELPAALRFLQQGNIAPVDFAQAAIGPGMAIYSRYSQIIESGGTPMGVRAALTLINQTLTEVLSEQEDDFDFETRWAIAWFEQHGFGEGEFGDAEILSKAKVTSVSGLQQFHIIYSKGGKVRLLRPEDIPQHSKSAAGRQLSIWEMTHHLLGVYFHDKAGDVVTANLLRSFGANGEMARELAYQLFHICEKRKRSQEAQAYNALVLGWPEIARLAREGEITSEQQSNLFGQER